VKTLNFKAKLWLYQGTAAWHFITVPKKESNILKESKDKIKRGWGSIPIKVTIGKTSWKTSVFPDKKSSYYLLPIKKEVRIKEDLYADETIAIKLTY
jgi:hypothetical protein